MDNLIRDIRYSIRTLSKRPGATTIAVVTLALGIAVNAAVFSVFQSVLLRPLPLRDPERVVSIWENSELFSSKQTELAPANFLDIRSQNQVFQSVGAYGDRSFNLTGQGEPERLEGQLITANVFDLLGTSPVLGRTFSSEEDEIGRHRVVVLSHSLWQRRFNSEATVIGRTITLDGESFLVVGVMPPAFFFPVREAELWVPWAMHPEEASGRGDHYLRVVARLKPGVSLEHANHDLASIGHGLAAQYPKTNEGLGFTSNPLHKDYVGSLRLPITVLFAAVGLVLCIACVNVANLLLVQTASRRKEFAIRVALGARRWVIVRQLLIQSLVLASLGGALGVLAAFWGIEFLSKLVPESLSQLQAVSLDVRVLTFAVVVTLFTGIFFGTLLALQISPTKPGEVLGEAGRDNTGGRRARFMRSALVVSEMTLALVLLIGAGLLIRSFHRLLQVDPGFSTDNLLTMSMVLSTPRYRPVEARRAFYDEMLRRVSELPGVENAGMISFLPLSFSGMNFSFSVEGQTLPSNSDFPMALYRVVSPGYLETMKIPLMRGRSFDAHDGEDSQPVVVVNSRLASRFWPNENPIGKRLKIGLADSPNPWATVVGVVTDVRQAGFYGDLRLEMYASYKQDRRGFTAPRDLVVRTKGDPRLLAGAIREAIHTVDKDQPVFNVKTMDEVLAATVSRERFQTLLLTVFAALALVLACIGLYGVISYTVAQRTREIGVRMALGANRRDVLKLVLKQALVLILIGTALGLTVAFWVTRLISEMLFHVTSTDPITFVGVTVVLNLVALLACYIPARRATKVDPLEALRYE